MSRTTAVGVVATMCVLAMRGATANARQPPVFKARVELVAVDATVVDRDGRPVEGLKAEDFAVTVDGRPRRIVTFSGRVRALVRVDAGRVVAGPAALNVGIAIVSDAGLVSQSETRSNVLPPTGGPDASWVLQSVMPLDPGAYTVRVAMTDTDGRLGSASVRVTAKVPQGPGASHSDLMLYDPARFGAGGPVPLIDGRVIGSKVSAVFEVYPSGGSSVTHFEFSLAKTAGPPEQTSFGRLTREADGAVVAGEADLDLSDLPPGDYTVTATAFAATRELARATTTFTKVPPS